MARTPKKGLDYSPWDVDVLLGDSDIDKLMESQGCAGFTIYFFLCQMAYKYEGYYLKWSYDDAATTAKRVGGGVGSETVRQTVNLCLQMGLFDRRLFDRDGVLTSRRIQETFMEARSRRVKMAVIDDYWLLEKNPNSGGLDNCGQNENSCIQKSNSCIQKSENCIQESQKVKESKYSSSRCSNAPAREGIDNPELGRVMDFYLDHFGLASSVCIGELKTYTETLGADVVLHALNIAIDEKKTAWSYINGILRRYTRQKLDSIEKVVRAEQDFTENKDRTRDTPYKGHRKPVEQGGFMAMYLDMEDDKND